MKRRIALLSAPGEDLTERVPVPLIEPDSFHQPEWLTVARAEDVPAASALVEHRRTGVLGVRVLAPVLARGEAAVHGHRACRDVLEAGLRCVWFDDEAEESWRSSSRCVWRNGPGFVEIVDRRGRPRRVVLEGAAAHTFLLLADVRDRTELPPRGRAIVDALAGEQLCFVQGDFVTRTPPRLRHWPVPSAKVWDD